MSTSVLNPSPSQLIKTKLSIRTDVTTRPESFCSQCNDIGTVAPKRVTQVFILYDKWLLMMELEVVMVRSILLTDWVKVGVHMSVLLPRGHHLEPES